MSQFYSFDEKKDKSKFLLTIIVPLIDRHKLTDRFLKNLNEQECNCKIILADGSFVPFTKYLEEKTKGQKSKNYFAEDRTPRFDKVYENLKIEYFYSGYDSGIDVFLKKMSLAANKVWTPFCVICDNDDIVDLRGLEKGAKFLANNIDYSTYRNDIRTLEIRPELKMKESLYTYDSIESECPKERGLYAIDHFNSFNFSVFRAGILKAFLEVMGQVNTIGDFQLFQKGLSYFASVIGKCKRLHDESYYYFIPGNSVLQDGSGKIKKFKDWAIQPYWPLSVRYAISIASSAYEFVHEKNDFREEFARKLIQESCVKAQISFPDEETIADILQSSESYDSMTTEQMKKNVDEIKYPSVYPCSEISETIEHKEFLKSLNI